MGSGWRMYFPSFDQVGSSPKSTAVIPHCGIEGISEFVVGILTAPNGVQFDSLDNELAKIIVFIIGPADDRNTHIRILATISQVLRIPGAKEEILAETNPEVVRESFLRYSRDEVNTKAHAEKSLFHVFVQDENRFHELLQVFAAIESCSISVAKTEGAGAFLHDIPLFSSFWHDGAKGFNRTITALISRSMVNDTIRRINDIAGGLDKNPGIMVTVQDVFYAGGKLD